MRDDSEGTGITITAEQLADWNAAAVEWTREAREEIAAENDAAFQRFMALALG